MTIRMEDVALPRAVVEQLDGLAYRFRTVGRERTFTSEVELIEWFPDACIQILASKSQ